MVHAQNSIAWDISIQTLRLAPLSFQLPPCPLCFLRLVSYIWRLDQTQVQSVPPDCRWSCVLHQELSGLAGPLFLRSDDFDAHAWMHQFLEGLQSGGNLILTLLFHLSSGILLER